MHTDPKDAAEVPQGAPFDEPLDGLDGEATAEITAEVEEAVTEEVAD